MAPLYRYGALPLLAALVLTTGCGPRLDLRSSSHLETLLPSSNAYPDGLTVEDLNVEEIEGADLSGASGAGDFEHVEPAGCGAILNGGTGPLPEGAVEGAAQTATPSGSSTGSAVYGYVLVRGDFGDAPVGGTGFGDLVDTCSRMSVSMDGTRLEGELTSEDSSPALPEAGGMFAMTLSDSGPEISARTAWGQVGDVYFVLVAMRTSEPSDVSPWELADACEGRTDFDCYDSYRAEAAAEADEQMAEDFGAVLERAVEKLEREA